MKRNFNSSSSSSPSSSPSYKKVKLKNKHKKKNQNEDIDYNLDIYNTFGNFNTNNNNDSSISSSNNNNNDYDDNLFNSDIESEDNLNNLNNIKYDKYSNSSSESNIDSDLLYDISNENNNFNKGVLGWNDNDDFSEKSSESNIKILSDHPYLKDNPEFIEKINKYININTMIEDNYTEKVLDEDKRQDFLRNCVIDYTEMKENKNKIPNELENIIKNLNFFNSKGYDIHKLVEDDKSGVLFRNLPLPYEQIKNAIIGQTMTGGMCIFCAMNGYVSKAIELLEKKLNQHIYSNNFCPILASIMISSQASKIIEKTNEYIKNNNNNNNDDNNDDSDNNNNNKYNIYVNDIAYNTLKECTPGSVMTHIMFHIQDFTAYCKILILDFKLQIEQQKKYGLGKIFSDPEKGIEYNVKLDPNVQDQIRKDVDSLLKLLKTPINTLNFSQQNTFKQDMLVHEYAESQKKKNKKISNVSFNGSIFNF